jgi:predicted RNase H-like HicB family nuclease
MAPDLIEVREGAVTFDVPPNQEWKKNNGHTYECRVILSPEDEGGYSAHAVNIAGVVSEGNDIPDAIANIREAFAATLEYYLESQTAIPWRSGDPEFFDSLKNSIELWISVDV